MRRWGMTVAADTPDVRLLIDLEPVVTAELERHLGMHKPWNPHDYVPWDEGRNFAFLGGEDWSPDQQRYSEAARSSLIVNLLTEDNLPSYHHEIATFFGRDGAWLQKLKSGYKSGYKKHARHSPGNQKPPLSWGFRGGRYRNRISPTFQPRLHIHMGWGG